MTRALIALACGALSFSAAAFPDFDPRRERAVVGAGDEAEPAARARGEWRVDERGLAMVRPAPGGWTYWLPTAEHARVADGMVRARFLLGRTVDATLLLRAAVQDDDPLALSGYGVSLEPGQVALYRWDDGRASELGVPTRLSALQGARRVEVVAFCVGPHVTASLYDADTLAHLATLSAHDPTYATGRVGLRAHARQGEDTFLELLAVTPASGDAPERDEPVALAPAGRTRRVEVALSDRGRLPRDLARAAIVDDDRLVLVTTPAGAERVRRAGVKPLVVSGDVPWRWLDAAYRRARARGVVRTRRGFDVDASYKDAEMVEELLAAYAERFPTITRRVRLGTTHQGRGVWALKVSDHPERDEDEPAVLVNASHHGSELLPVELAFDVVQQLVEGYAHDREVRRLVDGFELWVVPLVNPDGNMRFLTVARGEGRKNGRDHDGDGVLEPGEGVDLNRNYPFRWGALGERGSRSWPLHSRYRGPAPGSEPETQAMMRLAERERFVASISFHTAATLILAPYTIDGVRSPEPDVAWGVAEELAAALPKQPGGKRYRVQRNIYPVDGTDQDWLFHEHGTLALLIEGPHHNPRGARLRRRSVVATRPALPALLRRFTDGPSLSGHVTAGDGRPLEAEVRVLEVETKEGERWTSRPLDGRFDRFLPGPGSYRVQARAPGYQTRTVTVQVDGHEQVELVLPKAREVGDREAVH